MFYDTPRQRAFFLDNFDKSACSSIVSIRKLFAKLFE